MLAAAFAGCAGDDTPPGLPELDCEVAIVGGGAGGLHTAYRLGPTLGDKVCVFEKEAEVGGRVKDVALDAGDPAAARFGVGARRVVEGQDVVIALADELGITLEEAAGEQDLINARGLYAFGKNDFLGAYPKMALAPEADADQETWLYDQLRLGPARQAIYPGADLRGYTRGVVGDEGYAFLHDMFRFRSDFEYPIDARAYMDYLDEEWDVCCTLYYPRGGMSEFMRRLADGAKQRGVRIFTGEPVASIDRAAGGGYTLSTAQHTVRARKVIVTVPPEGFKWIKGDIAAEIQARPQYNDILGVRVVTVTQWWPDAWWQALENPEAAEAKRVWRAWTTEHCLNFMEIPLEPYAAAQKVTRTVYDDDADCVRFWEELAARGTDAVEAEIRRGLEHLFVDSGVAPQGMAIPEPLKTHVQVWPAAWHWVKAGSQYGNADIAAWALEPLPGEAVAMVGEAYNPQRSGWTDGAYKSSIALLNAKYGMNLPSSPAKASKPGAARVRRWRGEAGR